MLYKIFTQLRVYFFTGLAVAIPLFGTAYLIFLLFSFSDNLLGRFINVHLKQRWGFYIPGLGLVLFLLIILTIGILARQFLGKRLLRGLEKALIKLPLIRHVYPSLKQIVDFFFSTKEIAFKKAVLVEYPRKGIWSLGFITNESAQKVKDALSEDVLNVFIPSAPGPLTGYFVVVPRKDIILLEMRVEEALKIIVSGGVLNP
ncbi:MAG: DUF502 domain-containing protein [Candidatus Omnitrophica bacterium]|nr:DUF502 domain-containing protein [Candidatus Omnitrophota bacterium]